MKKRTLQQIQESKALYRNHAQRYKSNDFPLHKQMSFKPAVYKGFMSACYSFMLQVKPFF